MNNQHYMTCLEELYSILKDAEQYGISFKQLFDKIAELKGNAEDETIRIVLISSFSDGKTSTIAGLLGRIEENMKIDSDESSDEIVVYKPEGMRQGFEIVDTPGLFGTKEKEINGESVRFSEITEKYISQAHIILYDCDAVNPLKESHAYVISKLIREYNKIDSTIFVINKMDEAGYDPLDESDFTHGTQIKTDNLKKRLRDTIALTEEEEKRLHVVCICADPKGKGMAKWFEKDFQSYLDRSHIANLRNKIDELIETTQISQVLTSTHNNTLVDLTQQAMIVVQQSKKDINATISSLDEKTGEISTDLVLLQKDLKSSRQEMKQQLDDLENQLLAIINSATPETIDDILEQQIGTESKSINFEKLKRKIDHIVSACTESNNVSIATRLKDIEKNISNQDKVLQDGINKGAKMATEFLKNTKISGETVKAIRDVIASSYKFKPWGAIKLANKVNKAMPWIGAGIETITSVVQTHKERKRQREFDEMKTMIKDELKRIIKYVFDTFKTDEEYYQNFAPSYLQLKAQLEDRQNQQEQLRELSHGFEELQTRLSTWLQSNAEDVEYEDIHNN